MILDIQCKRKCEVERITCKPVYEVTSVHAFMRPKRVLMKFDKLLSVMVRWWEQHVYYKLTNKRPIDTCLLTNNRLTDTCLLTINRHSVPMMNMSRASSIDHLGLYRQINKQTIQSCFVCKY